MFSKAYPMILDLHALYMVKRGGGFCLAVIPNSVLTPQGRLKNHVHPPAWRPPVADSASPVVKIKRERSKSRVMILEIPVPVVHPTTTRHDNPCAIRGRGTVRTLYPTASSYGYAMMHWFECYCNVTVHFVTATSTYSESVIRHSDAYLV